MRLTNKEIEQIEKDLQNINKEPFEKRGGPLQKIAIRLGAHVPISAPNSFIHLYKTIHTALQTEMMLNACVSAEQSSKSAEQSSSYAERSCNYAKWSCIFASVAALLGIIGLVLALLTHPV